MPGNRRKGHILRRFGQPLETHVGGIARAGKGHAGQEAIGRIGIQRGRARGGLCIHPAFGNREREHRGVCVAARARGTGSGRGYAVPIDQALAIAKQIESGASSATVHVGPTAFLGVALATSQVQGANGLGGQGGSTSGATVAGVLPGAPAAKAGLQAGDVITSLDGRRVDSASTLTSLVGRRRPGDRVQVVWTDQSGKTHTATVTLATRPAA